MRPALRQLSRGGGVRPAPVAARGRALRGV